MAPLLSTLINSLSTQNTFFIILNKNNMITNILIFVLIIIIMQALQLIPLQAVEFLWQVFLVPPA